MTETEARAASWLKAWDAQGAHRTGTAGDRAGAEWLAAEAKALGAEVAVEEFAVSRLDPVAASLAVGGEPIAAVPVFDAPATGPDGITGRLGAEIAVAALSPRAVYSGEFQALRRAGGHRTDQRRGFPDSIRRAGDPRFERGARPRAGSGAGRPPGAARRA
jgi:hypothetical protein